VQYTSDGGATWTTLKRLSGNPGRYDWTVPAAAASRGRCRVRVVLRADTGEVTGRDTSRADFNIGKVLLLSPNGGEAVASGGTIDIAWAAVPAAVSFNLYYTLNGENYLPLPGGEAVTGTAWRGAWPAVARSRPRSAVRVVGYDAGGARVGSDVSDAFFTTRP
jgi:hypothetical protein